MYSASFIKIEKLLKQSLVELIVCFLLIYPLLFEQYFTLKGFYMKFLLFIAAFSIAICNLNSLEPELVSPEGFDSDNIFEIKILIMSY